MEEIKSLKEEVKGGEILEVEEVKSAEEESRILTKKSRVLTPAPNRTNTETERTTENVGLIETPNKGYHEKSPRFSAP